MSNNVLANEILAGSRELDRMKRDIHDLCTMIVGILNRVPSAWERGGNWAFQSNTCEWRLEVIRSPRYSGLGLLCTTLGQGFAYSVNWGDIKISRNQIQIVYDDLDTFVEGVLKEFPFLNSLLEPYTKAAKVSSN